MGRSVSLAVLATIPALLQLDQYRQHLLRQYRIATACKGAYGLSGQLPVLGYAQCMADRERYRCLLRDQSPVRVCAPAERCASPPILSLTRRSALT